MFHKKAIFQVELISMSRKTHAQECEKIILDNMKNNEEKNRHFLEINSSRPRQHDFCLLSAATNKRFLHFCNVAKAVTENCFVTTLKLWVLIWDYCQQDLVKFQTFISFTLYIEKTLKLNFLGKKKTFKTFFNTL